MTSRSSRSIRSEKSQISENYFFIEKFKSRIGVIGNRGTFSRYGQESQESSARRPSDQTSTDSRFSDVNMYMKKFIDDHHSEAEYSESLPSIRQSGSSMGGSLYSFRSLEDEIRSRSKTSNLNKNNNNNGKRRRRKGGRRRRSEKSSFSKGKSSMYGGEEENEEKGVNVIHKRHEREESFGGKRVKLSISDFRKRNNQMNIGDNVGGEMEEDDDEKNKKHFLPDLRRRERSFSDGGMIGKNFQKKNQKTHNKTRSNSNTPSKKKKEKNFENNGNVSSNEDNTDTNNTRKDNQVMEKSHSSTSTGSLSESNSMSGIHKKKKKRKVKFKPYTLSDYKKQKENDKKLSKLGGLGANMSEEVQKLKEKESRKKLYAENLRQKRNMKKKNIRKTKKNNIDDEDDDEHMKVKKTKVKEFSKKVTKTNNNMNEIERLEKKDQNWILSMMEQQEEN